MKNVISAGNTVLLLWFGELQQVCTVYTTSVRNMKTIR